MSGNIPKFDLKAYEMRQKENEEIKQTKTESVESYEKVYQSLRNAIEQIRDGKSEEPLEVLIQKDNGLEQYLINKIREEIEDGK